MVKRYELIDYTKQKKQGLHPSVDRQSPCFKIIFILCF